MADFIYLPWQTRVIAEKEELDKKIHHYKTFINSASSANVCVNERSLLGIQLRIMEAYSAVLRLRIDCFMVRIPSNNDSE